MGGWTVPGGWPSRLATTGGWWSSPSTRWPFAQAAARRCLTCPASPRSGPGLAATPPPPAQCPSGLPSSAAAASVPRWPVPTRAWAPPSPFWSAAKACCPGWSPLSNSWSPARFGGRSGRPHGRHRHRAEPLGRRWTGHPATGRRQGVRSRRSAVCHWQNATDRRHRPGDGGPHPGLLAGGRRDLPGAGHQRRLAVRDGRRQPPRPPHAPGQVPGAHRRRRERHPHRPAAAGHRGLGADHRGQGGAPDQIMSFTGLWIVCLVALAAPLAATAAGRLRVPSVVLEVVAGILIGPAVLGWVHVDRTISVVSAIGLAMLLFMAGREIDYSRLRGPTVELAALGMALSLVFALAIGFGLRLQHLVATPVFVAVVLSATGLGTLTPIFE